MQNANHRITLRNRPTGLATPDNSIADTVPERAPEAGVWWGAAGAVGPMAGRVGVIEGCRAGGIAGGSGKPRLLLEEHGFHAALDYKAEPDLTAAIARTCPDGINVFYDNVGGPILE